MLALADMLEAHNHYVQMYRVARERLQSPDAPNVAIQFFGDEGRAHGNWYSGPIVLRLLLLLLEI